MSGVEVEPLQLARVELPEFHPEAPGSDVVYGFLVRDGEDCILLDTGVGSGSALIDRLYAPDRAEVAAALARVGASLQQVTAIVNSHLHFDHCGNNSLFPDVPIFVQRKELEAAHQPHYTVPAWVDFKGARYVPVDGRHPISENLELIPTPGHTPGHQSLVVQCGDHVDVVVAQAAYTRAEFDCFLANGTEDREDDPVLQAFIQSNATWSKASYVSSLATIERLRPRRAFFSHDPEVWQCGP